MLIEHIHSGKSGEVTGETEMDLLMLTRKGPP